MKSLFATPLLKVTLPVAALFLSSAASATETDTRLPGHLERRFAALDVDDSNLIERSEAKIGGQHFRSIDKNGDGALSREEVLSAYRARVERFRKQLDKRRGTSSEPKS